MVELTSSAPRVQPIIHIKKYLHDSQFNVLTNIKLLFVSASEYIWG